MQTCLDDHSLASLVRVLEYADIKSNHISASIIGFDNGIELLIIVLLSDNSIGIPRIIPQPQLANATHNVHLLIRLPELKFEIIESDLGEHDTGFTIDEG